MARASKKKQTQDVQSAQAGEVLTSDELYHFAIRLDWNVSFWEENKPLMYMSPYRELIEEVGEKASSKIMDAIWLVYDMKSSYNNSAERSEESAKKEVSTYFLKDPKFKWEKYHNIIEAYKKDTRTKIEKELDFWYSQLVGKREYIKTLPWSVSAQEKNTLLKDNKKLFQDYFEVEALTKKEREHRRLRAGIHYSRVERKPKI